MGKGLMAHAERRICLSKQKCWSSGASKMLIKLVLETVTKIGVMADNCSQTVFRCCGQNLYMNWAQTIVLEGDEHELGCTSTSTVALQPTSRIVLNLPWQTSVLGSFREFFGKVLAQNRPTRASPLCNFPLYPNALGTLQAILRFSLLRLKLHRGDSWEWPASQLETRYTTFSVLLASNCELYIVGEASRFRMERRYRSTAH